MKKFKARRIQYSQLSHQKKFQQSTKPKVFMTGGYGSGKSYALVMKMLQLCNVNKGLPGGLLCPTLKMFKRDVLPLIRAICDENDIPYHFHKQDFCLTFPDTKSTIYIFHAEDDGQSIRGPNLAFFLINEVTLISKNAFDAALARVRLKNATLPQIACSGTPEGFNWDYDYFVANQREDTDLIFASTRENRFNSEGYVRMLEESYDDLLVQQFVDGKYVNIVGKQAVRNFDRRKHVYPIERIEFAPIWVTLDFNVDPMSAVLWNPLPKTQKVWLQAFDEIKISGSNTYEICAAIKQKIGTDNVELVTIYPDPAGRATSTKTRFPVSDLQILKNEGFPDLKYKSRINVRDCLNALNNLFHKDRIGIDPKCKEFISDLEQCKIKDALFEIDKTNPKRSHWLDGAKNMAGYEFPVVRPAEHRSVAR